MRRPLGWTRLILALAASAGILHPAAAADESKAEKINVGFSRAYEILGRLALMHEGRIKPLDTVAREEIKSIYTRETIKLTGDAKIGKTITSWAPVAAFFDWSVRPKFWDQQPIISVEYLPLKRFILAEEIKAALEVVAGKAATSEADRARLKSLIDQPEVDAQAIRAAIRDGKLAEGDARTLEKLAEKVGEETKWLTPEDLETADVTVDGKKLPFVNWLDDVTTRRQKAKMGTSPKLSDLEDKGYDVGVRLGRYRAVRDKESMGMVPLLVVPRPASQAMLTYSADAAKKVQEVGERGLSPLEYESAGNLFKYLNDIPIQDRAMPGTDPKFDARYTAWLKEKSAWVPLGVIREAPIEDLSKAGYPASKLEAFRLAFKAMEDEELANPGRAGETPALALVEASRELGDSVNASFYPTTAAMTREVHFNEFAPFFKAPIAYGVALLALIFSLVVANFGVAMKMESAFGKLAKGLYMAGIASFVAGIGLEAYGFFLRIKITGWAPVTNMYETVIWVAMITSVLGFVLEAIYRKTYAALAASGVALLGTALAATVPMLDPDIHQLPPVLRNNFWLTIHVLTIVSSYAAFALAMGLGVAATSLYLTATYKRSAGFVELASPILPGLPLLGLGILGAMASYGRFGASDLVRAYGFYPSVAVGCVGGLLSAMAVFSIVGELINRSIFRKELSLDGAALAGAENSVDTYRSTLESSHEGGTAVLTVAEPRVAPAVRPKLDARTKAMQATAAQIKPISNFIYRSMQVGILLVAAGTFLGGWWADVSWGRFWGWDPKEVWALITLLVYLIPLHGRFAGWVNTFWLVMASVVCFLSVLMAWYGVNFVLGVGLHSYGFTEGGSQGTVGVATLVVLAFAAGAYWRRHLSQKVAGVSI